MKGLRAKNPRLAVAYLSNNWLNCMNVIELALKPQVHEIGNCFVDLLCLGIYRAIEVKNC
jgi:hypothetical protein